ncbi:MAG: hypothetical protein GKS06_04145 [Acidobacteria bacterium]|nr:hypothetical protein [Acidobacteriota bacterium]
MRSRRRTVIAATPALRRLAGPLLAIASVGLSLLVAEAGVRVVAPQPTIPPLYDELHGIRTNVPSVDGDHFVPATFRVRIRTSAQRFRGAENYTPTPVDGTFRVAMLGDSFTFGIGARDSETYPAALERELGGCLRAEVINAGVKATGTGDQALRYHNEVRSFSPNLVVLSVLPANDLGDVAARPLFAWTSDGGQVEPMEIDSAVRPPPSRLRAFVRGIPGYELATQRSQLLGLVRYRVSAWMSTRREAPSRNAEQNSPSAGVTRRNQLDAAASLIRGQILWLDRQVREAGGRLAVVILPWASMRDARGIVADFAGELEAFGDHAEIPTYNLARAFGETRYDPAEFFHCCRDSHPNESGYAMMAREVAAFLKRTGVVGNRCARESGE